MPAAPSVREPPVPSGTSISWVSPCPLRMCSSSSASVGNSCPQRSHRCASPPPCILCSTAILLAIYDPSYPGGPNRTHVVADDLNVSWDARRDGRTDSPQSSRNPPPHTHLAVGRLRAILEGGKDPGALRSGIALLDRIWSGLTWCGTRPSRPRSWSKWAAGIEARSAERDPDLKHRAPEVLGCGATTKSGHLLTPPAAERWRDAKPLVWAPSRTVSFARMRGPSAARLGPLNDATNCPVARRATPGTPGARGRPGPRAANVVGVIDQTDADLGRTPVPARTRRGIARASIRPRVGKTLAWSRKRSTQGVKTWFSRRRSSSVR